MGEAVALLSALSGIYNTIDGVNTRNQANQQYQQAMNKPSMSYEQAMQRAGDTLNPLYDTQLKQNLSNVDNHNMQRGFYGQLAGDALRNNRATEVETQRVGQTASLANQMMGQDQQSMMSQQQLAAQYAA